MRTWPSQWTIWCARNRISAIIVTVAYRFFLIVSLRMIGIRRFFITVAADLCSRICWRCVWIAAMRWTLVKIPIDERNECRRCRRIFLGRCLVQVVVAIETIEEEMLINFEDDIIPVTNVKLTDSSTCMNFYNPLRTQSDKWKFSDRTPWSWRRWSWSERPKDNDGRAVKWEGEVKKLIKITLPWWRGGGHATWKLRKCERLTWQPNLIEA